ncbi:MAG: hypothetical protein IKZ87_09340 [Actinomycetaceae bacterium]|nr:hypothetical protein [Actinomycetaceae bacterium]
MSGYGRSRFANELNIALEEASMTPEDLVTALNRRGFPLPPKTLSYWLQGYFLPRNDTAFALVADIEDILDIRQSALSEALVQDIISGGSFVPGEFTAGSVAPPPAPEGTLESHFAFLNENIDWEADLVRKVIHDDVTISVDWKHRWYKTTVLARVPSVPNPSFTVCVAYDDGDKPGGAEHFYGVEGARMGKMESYTEDGVSVFGLQLYLPDGVVPGEMHRISYAWDLVIPVSRNSTVERSFPWLLDFYSCTITFEGGVPENVEYVMRDSGGNERVAGDDEIFLMTQGNTVRMSAKNPVEHTGYFRWLDKEEEEEGRS